MGITTAHVRHIHSTDDKPLALYKAMQVKAIANSEREHWSCGILCGRCC